jgi:hypothetical protein
LFLPLLFMNLTALAVAEPSKEKVAIMMHLTWPMLNIGGRQVSINPYRGSEGAKTSKTCRALLRVTFGSVLAVRKSKVQF